MSPAETILSVDPSLRATGYGVLRAQDRKVKVVDCGVVAIAPREPLASCLRILHETLSQIILLHHPSAMAIESVIYVQSHRTAIALGAAFGAALLAAARAGVPVYEYAPRRVKQAVVGRGAAQKQQVAFMVRALLGMDHTPPPDAADALAVGITHLQTRKIL